MGARTDWGAATAIGVALPERYEPIRRIARGGMATVWCARDHTLDRRVAIKLLADRYAQDELAGRRFKREARAAARLSGHPNVVTIYDVGQAPSEDGAPGHPFLVMEYLPGGTVADALRTGTVDRSTALTWLQQAAAALDYAHRRGVIHRDVKLGNFLLDRERVLHVADFGIAQLGSEDTLTVSGEVLGTAAYLAPERALGQPATDASDRYALAVAAYELLVGRRPFGAEHFAAQARQHVEEPPPRASLENPELPTALDAVLARGMAKRPEQRFATARELVEAVDQAFAAPTTATRPMAAATAATRPMVASPRPRPVAAASDATRAEPAPTRTPRGRIAALAALAAVLLGVAIAAAASGPATSRSGSGPHATLLKPATSRHGARARGHHRATAASRTAPVVPPAGTATGASTSPPPAPAPAPAAGAAALEAQGHALMAAGNYRSAISLLRQAVAAAAPTSLTYAYALYDLGRSLRLAGDPRAAVPILWRRLQIPNQTSVVRAELALALEALGQQASSGSAPAHGHHHGRGGGGG